VIDTKNDFIPIIHQVSFVCMMSNRGYAYAMPSSYSPKYVPSFPPFALRQKKEIGPLKRQNAMLERLHILCLW